MTKKNYEERDAHIKQVIVTGIALFAVIGVVSYLMKPLFWFFEARTRPAPPVDSPFAGKKEPTPSPLLEVHPNIELGKYLEAQSHQLNSYGWVNPEKQIARIPVDVAIQKILAQGSLASRQNKDAL